MLALLPLARIPTPWVLMISSAYPWDLASYQTQVHIHRGVYEYILILIPGNIFYEVSTNKHLCSYRHRKININWMYKWNFGWKGPPSIVSSKPPFLDLMRDPERTSHLQGLTNKNQVSWVTVHSSASPTMLLSDNWVLAPNSPTWTINRRQLVCLKKLTCLKSWLWLGNFSSH